MSLTSEFVKSPLLPLSSIHINSDDDELNDDYFCRSTSGAMSANSLYQISTSLYDDRLSIQHSDAENDISFNVPDTNVPQYESNILSNDFRKRSLNLNINIQCPPIPDTKARKRKQHSAFVSESVSKKELQLILEESRSIRSSSVQSDIYQDTIGDLGNLSDFTENNNINFYGPYRAKEELQFVDVCDCDTITDSNILNHIHINIPYSAMDILCNNPLYKQNSIDENDTSIYNEYTYDISHFIPNTYDICLMMSYPFNINKDTKQNRLEYLQHSLPNRIEIQHTVRNTLIDRKCDIRYAHFNATQSTIKHIASSGGCKILQFVAYCCNPVRDKDEYPDICSLCDYSDDTEYILLETEMDFGGEGVWYTVSELSDIINAKNTRIDVIICISPQHRRLTQIFKSLGFKYVIGIESPRNDDSFSCTETAAFLTHLYDRLLDTTSISHAFDLSLQAALSVRGSIKSSNYDAKYIFNAVFNERYVVFNDNDTECGELTDLSLYKELPQSNLSSIQRPMIGRSKYISRLLYNMCWTKIINVTGRELIGRSTVVKYAVRYLLEMGLFRGGCFVIDCKAKKYQGMRFNECVMDVMKSCSVTFNAEDAMCFVILNTNDWHRGEEDIAKWMDEYHDILFKHSESRVICTGNRSLQLSCTDVLNMSNLPDLRRSQLAELFVHFCSHILEFNFSLKDICDHDALQRIFGGSPGMTQKVAQFVIFNNNNDSVLSLDEMVVSFHKMNKKRRLRDWSSEPFYFNDIPCPSALHKESQSMCLYHVDQTPDPFPLIACSASRSLPSHSAMNLDMNIAAAKEIWIKSCNKTLNDLYPHLISWFQPKYIPSLSEIESFFCKNGGIKNGLFISLDKFYGFFSWFHSMCNMMSDLQFVYTKLSHSPLFYSRDIAKQSVAKSCSGTFMLRFASQINGLAITYKKSNGKISNVLLKRISDRIYKVGKTAKRTDLFELIHSWSTLKYLYINKEYILNKDLVFRPMHESQSSLQLSMKQSITQKTDEFYAEIESTEIKDVFDENYSIKNAQYILDENHDLNNQIDEIVMNFSDIAPDNKCKCKHLKEENINLKKEIKKLKDGLFSSRSSLCSSTNSCSTPVSPYQRLFKHQ